ncbi:sensor histidine kinase [Roseococcus sp.]|uniref:sensor histidine kinase n=1 Tax=Roseococcus sp. TaxID=2109646 RepID=UPI003BAD8663
MPARSPSLLGSGGQLWALLPFGLAALLIGSATLLLVGPQRETSALVQDQSSRLAAELAARAEAVALASAVFAGRLEGSLARGVGDLVAQANRRALRLGQTPLEFSARSPAGQWLGTPREVAPRADGVPAFELAGEGLQLVTGQQPGPGGFWTVTVVLPWLGLLRELPAGGRIGLLQEHDLLAADGARTLPALPQAGRGEGPFSRADAFVALAPIAGTPAQVVAEIPAAGLLTRLEAQRRAVLFGAAALAALIVLLWFGLSALLARREAAARRRIETATAEQEQRALKEVSRFFMGLPAAVWRGEIFPDGTVLVGFMSEGVARITGLEAEDASGPGRWRNQLDAESIAAVEDFHRRLIQEGEAFVDYAFTRADGKRIWLRERARITGIGAHEGAEVAGVITDITSERQLGESAVMSSKLATLGKMAASIAHELTQPLGAITLASETAMAVLPQQQSGDAARIRVARITQQAERARTLIEHLRAFGRADSGPLEAAPLQTAVTGAMILAGPLLQTAGIELSTDIPEGLPPLRARPVLLEQILVNLFVNARDALARQPDGERRLALRAAASEDGRTVTMTVEDSGPGFPEDVLAKVFEPFFTTKAMGQGTGLGLSICQSIITTFGGSIAARNTGHGAEFTLTFRTWQPDHAAGDANANEPNANVSNVWVESA